MNVVRSYSTLNLTDCSTFPSCTTSQRQSPAASSPRFFELHVRHGDPLTVCFTRPASASPLYHTNSMSESAAPLIFAKQYSFPASALNDSAAPESARSATAVPTAASTLAEALGAPACSCAYARAGIAIAEIIRTAGQ